MNEPKRTPAEVLLESRRAASVRKRDNVFRTVDEMKRSGAEITFASVARHAGVSSWLVYQDGVREYVVAAREHQAAQPAEDRRAGRAASDASLRTDLELAKQDNQRLRAELAQLKVVVRERLGQRLEVESSQTLRNRVDELVEANHRLQQENLRSADQIRELGAKLAAKEDDLAAARTSLRRMIKRQSTEIA
ncbi:DUF6262 family protein [Mycobacterium sp. SMC-18]|uniref:DUF6262 family protein n=1 Tax=Mycobacterium sp. SMC-18 TaxID=3381629 RepID=UPI003876799B